MKLALRAVDLGKRYPFRRSYHTLRDELSRWFFSKRPEIEWIWPIRHVDFEIREGEIVGILGHNGAGKSTLLKCLSRIATPSEGYAEVFGRLCALLEVGTGFHSELTGRENIFLNGSLLGLSRQQLRRRFDAIVEFSGLEAFLDTPFKHYSRGMQLRLGFAVAVHVEHAILLFDEVFAVGDAAFHQKCLAKMAELKGSGRTLLIVSHQLEFLRQACGRCLWFDTGRLVGDGPPQEIIDRYLLRLKNAPSHGIMPSAHVDRTLHPSQGGRGQGHGNSALR